MTNSNILVMVKEITIARVSNTNSAINKEGGENVADFMQSIYDKLVELNVSSNS